MKAYPSKKKYSARLPLTIIILIGVSFSLLLFLIVNRRETITLDREFKRMANNRVMALQRSVQAKCGILESLRCFFESSELVKRREFNTFAASFSEFREILALAWLPRVPDSERADFEAHARLEIPDFYIKQHNEQGDFVPAQTRGEYFPIFYVDPVSDATDNILGFDSASDPSRSEALWAACDNNCPVATGKVQFIHDAGGADGFLIFLPVYTAGRIVDTVDRRRENLEGFIVGAFYVHELVERALSLTDMEHISVYLADTTAPPDAQFLFYYPTDDDAQQPVNPPAVSSLPSGLYTTDVIDVGTRRWSLLCTAQPALIDLYKTGNAWAVLAVGLLLTLSAVIFFVFSWRRTEAVQRLVKLRTEELQRELTHRIEAEQKLAKTARQLEIKNDELERVIYIASHDLRSPLITISGFDKELEKSCEELKALIESAAPDEQRQSHIRDLLDEAIPESLTFINTGVTKAQMLIDALLQVSRIGTTSFNIAAINMNELMSNVVDIQRFQARLHHVDITVDDLPDCMGDPPKTNQVFSNLIDNAIKYLSPDRPGKIRITGRRDHERCIYCIEDNGIGVEPENQTRIFQMFNRACKNPAIGGDGLGLAIVVRILEGQDGEVWLESEPGKGSQFFVALPSA